MIRSEIQQALLHNHNAFILQLKALSESEFLHAPTEKWTPGQHLDHIVKSTLLLARGMMLPKFVLRKMFGSANRPSKSYEALIGKYQAKIKEGGKASGKFIPPPVPSSQKEQLIRKLMRIIRKMNARLNKFSENDLDALIVPHPLLGKITLREMMYFTLYHVTHHQSIIARDQGILA